MSFLISSLPPRKIEEENKKISEAVQKWLNFIFSFFQEHRLPRREEEQGRQVHNSRQGRQIDNSRQGRQTDNSRQGRQIDNSRQGRQIHSSDGGATMYLPLGGQGHVR